MCGAWDGLAPVGPRTRDQGRLWSGNLRVSRVARMSVPRRQGGNREAFLHLISKAMLHPFHRILPLFLAVLGLHCCSRAFSSYGSQAPEHGLVGGGTGATCVVAHRLSCPEGCGIFPDQGWNLSSALVHQGNPSTIFFWSSSHAGPSKFKG